jgi:hypothetical protein
MTIVDGKIYATTFEHSTTMPLYRGWIVHCVDLETGQGIWNITGLMPAPAIADGYAVSLNGMDNQVYCFGNGQTATTVTLAPKVITFGDSALIEGTVTDQSPGAEGTPAVADESMTTWMEYIYKQQQKPTDVKGVTVSLDVLDSNNNWVHIGTTTTDANGAFSLPWTPEIPGKHTVFATFEGSKAYFTSTAETAISVTEAPPTPTPSAKADVNVVSAEMFYAVSAILIVLILVVAVLSLRKK